MPTLTESVHTGEFLVSEGNNTISREQIELAPSLTLQSGTVLGKNTATDVYRPLDVDASGCAISFSTGGSSWPQKQALANSGGLPKGWIGPEKDSCHTVSTEWQPDVSRHSL